MSTCYNQGSIAAGHQAGSIYIVGKVAKWTKHLANLAARSINHWKC